MRVHYVFLAALLLDTVVTVRVKDAPLSTFLDSISSQSHVSFIAAKELEGTKVTAYLEKVRVRDALDVLQELEGIYWSRVGKTDVFMLRPVSPSAPRRTTKVYEL